MKKIIIVLVAVFMLLVPSTLGVKAQGTLKTPDSFCDVLSSVGTYKLLSPIPGVVLDVRVQPGDAIKPGDVVILVECMEAEYELSAEISGTVRCVHVSVGDVIEVDQILLCVESN